MTQPENPFNALNPTPEQQPQFQQPVQQAFAPGPVPAADPTQFQQPAAQGFPQASAPQQFPQAPAPSPGFPQAPAPQQFPQAPAAPQFQQAPAAPQGFAPAAPAQGYAPPQDGFGAPAGFAPAPAAAPAAAPMPPYTPTVASPDALNPANEGVNAFGSAASKHSLRTDMGKPILIRIHGTRMMPGRPGSEPYEAVECDWIVLDASPVIRTNALISNRRVVVDLKNTLANNKRFLPGRVTEVPSQHPQPAISLAGLTDQEKEYALNVGKAAGWFE